ncbi:MAG TPA: extracellular solute-binding protein [Chloroflexota bacterium]|nr:extracellular solute-binding protein [Chloroflexota bacterium]
MTTGLLVEGRSDMAISRRRLIRGGALALGTGAVMAACSPGGGGGDRIAQGKSDKEVTIRWSTWDVSTGGFTTEAAPKGIKLFNEKFPKIKIVAEGQDGDWTTKNKTEWIAGTGPDMSGHCCTAGVQWAREGLFLDLEPKMKKDVPSKIREDYVEWLIKLFNQPGAGQFGLPMYTGTLALYYNKTLFQKKGVAAPDDTWDWNKYREAAIKLNDPAAGIWGRRQVRGIDRVVQKIHQAGGNWVDPKDDTKPAFTSSEALQGLQYERDANVKDKYTSREGEVANTQGLDLWKGVSAQRWGMWEEGSWILVRMATLVEKDVVGQWDVAPVPKGPKQRDTLATHDGWAIWKGTKNPDEAWEFLKFLQDDQWMEIAATVVGHQPARKSFQSRWVELIKKGNPLLADKNLKPFTDAIAQNYARPKEFFKKNQTEAETIINTFLNEAVYSSETSSAIKNGEKALDAAAKDAAARVADLMK